MAKILVDVDEVCADLLSEWLRRYNMEYGDTKTIEDMHYWDMTRNVYSHVGKEIYKYLDEPDLYDYVQVVPYAEIGVRMLRCAGHRVTFVTSCSSGQMAKGKIEWLFRHGFIQDIEEVIVAKNKGMIRGDIMIDDYVENLRAFGGKGILMTRQYNKFDASYPHATWLSMPAIVERQVLSAA